MQHCEIVDNATCVDSVLWWNHHCLRVRCELHVTIYIVFTLDEHCYTPYYPSSVINALSAAIYVALSVHSSTAVTFSKHS